MSSSLYRLGRLMARRAKLVLVVWLVAFVGAGLLAAGAGGELQDDLTIPGTESQAGIDVLERQFPEAAGTSGQVLFVAPDDVRDHRREIRAVLARVEAVDQLTAASAGRPCSRPASSGAAAVAASARPPRRRA